MPRLRRPRKKESQSILQKLDNFIGRVVNTEFDIARKAVAFPSATGKKIGDATTAGIKQGLTPVRERLNAIGRSVQTHSVTPLKESFRQQFDELNPNKASTPQERLRRTTNFALIANLDAGHTPIKPKPGVLETVKNFLRPAEAVVAHQGQAGKELKSLLTRTIDQGEVQAGKRVAQLTEARLNKLSKPEKLNLLDSLEGRAKPMSQKVVDAFRIVRTQTDELADYAKQIGVKVKRRTEILPEYDATKFADDDFIKGLTPGQQRKLMSGSPISAVVETPFEKRTDFYPHKIPAIDDLKPHRIPTVSDLKKSSVRKDVIQNLVRLKIKPDEQSAKQFVDDYVNFIETGGRQESLINYMVQSGQSKDAAEAFSNLQKYRNKTIKRVGSLEYSRDIDLPFYDPDPSRVIPKFVADEAARLEHIKGFGQDHGKINQLILKVRDSGGDADTVRVVVDRALGMINDANTPAMKVSRALRMVQGFKLGLATIPNSAQGVLNSLLAADMRAVAAGVRGVLRSQGRKFALKSGATLDSTLQETLKESGALSTFLKVTGFSATERMNRTIAANAGKSYGARLFETLLKNPNNKRAKRLIEELGVDTASALKRGSLNEDDILMLAKKFTDLTQFRSRPQDLPIFASSPGGRVFFQFKNYIYGQTRLLYKTFIDELKNKNFARATRNLLILGTVFPIAGEVIADLRSVANGKKRDSEGLKRYFEDLAQVGAMGILLDTLQAGEYGKGVDFLTGPTVSDAGGLVNIAGGDNKGRNLGKYVTKRIPILGSRLSNEFFPSKSKETKPKRIRRRLR